MPLEVVKIKSNVNESILNLLEMISDKIKENPDAINSLIIIVKEGSEIKLFNNSDLSPINIIGQLEFAKYAVLENHFLE